jgi:3D (Asp-Asp-Asp) domain-containing protein/peptidoglycan hydrolase CwlO-like protein
VAAVLTAVTALLGAAGAHANQNSETTRETLRLRSENDALQSERRGVVLELYSLESELARVGARIDDLEGRAAAVRSRQEAARDHLAVVRASLAEAERRLGERLRQLYVEGEADPLEVLLGAESLGDALSTIDNLDRFAQQDRTIVGDVKRGRAELRTALDRLARESAEVDALLAEAEQARAALLAKRADRAAYLERIRREERLNEQQLADALAVADAAEQKSQALTSGGGSSGGGGAPAPPPAPVPIGAGQTITVEATGYSLQGTTATGVPVGWGVVAVDPSVIPLGTRMTIPGYGEGVAADTGSAVRGRIIDLWFPTTAQALAWGRRTVTITIH